MIDFSYIELSKDEFKLLERIEAQQSVLINEIPKKTYARLAGLYILESVKTTHTKPDGSEHPETVVFFGDKGRDFLYYYRNKLREKRAQSIRYWITTGIAVTALILSIISLVWQAYTWKIDRQPVPDATGAVVQPAEQPAPPAAPQGQR